MIRSPNEPMNFTCMVFCGLVAAVVVLGVGNRAFAMPWQPERDWTVTTQRGEYGIKDWGEVSTLHFASVTFEIPLSGAATVTIALFAILALLGAVVIVGLLITRRTGRN